MNIKKQLFLVTLASLTMMFAGCSKEHSQSNVLPTDHNLGVVNILDGQASTHTSADGKVFTITPTVLSDNNVKLSVTVASASGAKEASFDFQAQIGSQWTHVYNDSNELTLTLQLSK